MQSGTPAFLSMIETTEAVRRHKTAGLPGARIAVTGGRPIL
jgi:acetyl-CoA carboxylase beta subunit